MFPKILFELFLAHVDEELVQNLNHVIYFQLYLWSIIRRVPAQKMESLITPKTISYFIIQLFIRSAQSRAWTALKQLMHHRQTSHPGRRIGAGPVVRCNPGFVNFTINCHIQFRNCEYTRMDRCWIWDVWLPFWICIHLTFGWCCPFFPSRIELMGLASFSPGLHSAPGWMKGWSIFLILTEVLFALNIVTTAFGAYTMRVLTDGPFG